MFTMRSPEEDNAALLYDHVFSARPDLDFYKWAPTVFGAPILEVGCGTGRVLIPTALSGFQITGIDPNASRVKRCVEKIAENGVSDKAEALVATILDYRTEQRFALVTMPYRSFQHILTPAEQEIALRNIMDLLKPGGHCIIDVFNPNIQFLANAKLGEEIRSESVFPLPDGTSVKLFSRVVERNYTQQIQHCEEIYIVRHTDGLEHRIVLPFTSRYTFKYEVEHLSRLVGFRVLETFGDFEQTPFGDEANDEILMILQKPEARND
jgi:SAM-dependent methyltransferase